MQEKSFLCFLCFLFVCIFLFCAPSCGRQSTTPAVPSFSLCRDGHDLVEVEALPSTCTESGIKAHSRCTRCGGLFDQNGARVFLENLTLPPSHTFSDGVCTLCGATETEVEVEPNAACQHSGGQATCQSKAICEICGAPYGRLAAHEKVRVVAPEYLASEATCTRRASYHASCALCGFAYAETFTDGEPLGHEGKATCLEKAVCTRCGVSFGQLGEHDFSLEIVSDQTFASPASHFSGATYYKTCSVCGKVGDSTFTFGSPDDSAHSFAVDYSTTDNAVHTLVCESCGFAKVESHVGYSASCLTPVACAACGTYFIPPDSHAYQNGACIRCGKTME